MRRDFEDRHGRAPVARGRAPGRVNLIGEHTDYTGGLALPFAIDPRTEVLATPRDDDLVRVHSAEMGSAERDLGGVPRQESWSDYVVAPFLALRERGLRVRGADLLVASDVPRESGLSSSAALGVAVTAAVDRAFGLGLDRRAWAEVAHRGENFFVGVGCGVMDQFASALGEPGHLLRIDCRDRSTRTVALQGDAVVLVAQSGVERKLAGGAYRERVDACAAALAGVQRTGHGATSLRDVAPSELAGLEAELDPIAFRRLRHVVTENARVDAACEALAAGDLERVGDLLREGMASLRDDYQVSTPELDALCELGDAADGCFGSRLTGAGFGGCTLHLVRPEAADAVSAALAQGFARAFGREPPRVVVRASDGASAESLL